jgi:iron complex outermembrane recepter protein
MKSRRGLYGATLVALTMPAAGLRAETRGLAGRVVDGAGDPVPRAQVELRCNDPAHDASWSADDAGRFVASFETGAGCRLVARPPAGGEPAAVAELDALAAGGPLELRLPLDLFAERIEVRETGAGDSVGSREIRDSLARDAGEALAGLAGVAKLRKGGLANDVVVRGMKGENLAVRVDGQALHGACPNRMDPPAFHVDFAEVERIEVRKGPFDVATGGVGGSVEVVTRQPPPGASFEASATAGSFGYLAPSATAGYGGERWSVKAGAASRRGDPYEDGDGRRFTELLPATQSAAYRPSADDERAFDVRTGWVAGSWTPRPGQRLELSTARQEAAGQLYPYLAMDATFDDASRVRLAYRAQGLAGWMPGLEVSVGFARVDHAMDDRLRASSTGAPRPYSMATDADALAVEARARLELRAGWRVGWVAERRDWASTTRLAGRGYRPQASLPETRADTFGLYADRRQRVAESVELGYGVRVERAATSATPELADSDLYAAYHATRDLAADDLLLSGNVDLAWTPTERWRLTAKLGSVERSPDGQERYFALRRMGSDWVGNPTLVPMRNSALELGARHAGERVSGEIAIWAARLDDAVTLVEGARQQMVPGVMNAAARTYVNHDQQMWGAEATARLPLGDAFVLAATASVIRGERDLAPERGVIDRDLPELPPATARLALRWQPASGWLEGEVVAFDDQSHVDSGLEETPTQGAVVFHLRGGVERGRFGVVAGVENLFDRAWREHLSYQRDPFRAGVAVPEPGRSFSLAIRWRG